MSAVRRARHKVQRTFARSRVVEERGRFLVREFFAPVGRVHAYELPDGCGRVLIRHRTQDLGTLDEVFVVRDYAMPEVVQAAIAAAPVREIADLGANVGMFAVHAIRRFPEAHITAFEPDAANAQVLRACIARNDAWDRCRVRTECVSNQDGVALFSPGKMAESRVTADGSIEIAQVDFFDVAKSADLVKLDIEGSEWPILRDERLCELAARAIVLEWHEVGDGRSSEQSALDELHRAGFEAVATVPGTAVGIIWAWR